MWWHVGLSANRRKADEGDFGTPPTLESKLEYFTQKAEEGCNLSQEPFVQNYEVWLESSGHQLDTPDWWEELMVIPHVDGHHRLAQKVRASFKIPWVRSKALKDYSSPSTPKCIGQEAFLLILDPRIPCQDYREGQFWKTLAYA